MCGRVPCPERRYIATPYALSDGDDDGGGVSRARSAARARALSRRKASSSALIASDAARAASDAINAELEALRLESARARAALRARETPPPSSSPSESA